MKFIDYDESRSRLKKLFGIGLTDIEIDREDGNVVGIDGGHPEPLGAGLNLLLKIGANEESANVSLRTRRST